MKNLVKKLLLIAGMATVFMTASAFAKTNDAIFIEGESPSRSTNTTTTWLESFSGGKGIGSWQNGTTFTGNITAEYDFSVEKDGYYDIWSFATGMNEWSSVLKCSVDDGEYSAAIQKVGNGAKNGQIGAPMCWQMMTKTYLTAGVHTLKYLVDAPRIGGKGDAYIFEMDYSIIVPSERSFFGWGTDRPAEGVTVDSDGVWLEAENYSRMTGKYTLIEHSTASGGRLMKVFQWYAAGAEDTVSTLGYDFSIKKEQEYDIYVLSSDGNESWLSRYEYQLDDGEYKKNDDKTNVGVYATNGDSVPLRWFKLEDGITLTAGNHSLNFKADLRADGTHTIHALDCIVIVPRSFDWLLPEGIPAANRNQFIKDSLNIPETASQNFNVPTVGPCETTITWTSDKTSVLAPNGTEIQITRPKSFESDATVNLTAEVKSSALTTNYAFPVKVPKEQLWTIIDSNVTYKDGSEIGKSLESEKVISAKVNLECNTGDAENPTKPASIIIALYDRNKTMLGMSVETLEIGSTAKELSAELALPKDVNGKYISVFLWNSLDSILPITDAQIFGK